MRWSPLRKAGLLAVAGVFLAAGYVLADTVAGDGDTVVSGNQSSVSLGEVAAGSTTNRSASFELQCTGARHADNNQTVAVNFNLGGSTVPAGGTLSAGNTTIGAIPASWPDDAMGSGNCGTPAPAPIQDNGDVTVSITAPTAPGTYTYVAMFSAALSPTGANDSSSITGAPQITYTLSVNTAPTANSQLVSLNEDGSLAITLSGSDPEKCNLIFSIVPASGPSNGSLGPIADNPCTAGTPNTDTASVTYMPNGNFNGSDSFQFKVNDGAAFSADSAAATVTITVNSVNDPPSGGSPSVTTIEELPKTFAASDFTFTDPADSPANALQSVVIASLPTAGTLKLSGSTFTVPQEILVADIPNLTFEPAPNGNGTPYATFTFQVRDNGGTADGGVDLDPTANTMTVIVLSINDAPEGSDQSVTTLEDFSYIFSLANFPITDANDSPANSLFTVLVTSTPAQGTLVLDGVGTIGAGTEVFASDISAGKLSFVPAANDNGTLYATFTFKVRDDGGATDGGVNIDPTDNTMTINVTAVNDEPSFNAGGDQTVNEDAGAQTVGNWATSISAGPADESSQTLTFQIASNSNAGLFSTAPAVSSAGTLTYTPAANQHGSSTIGLRLIDNGGTANGGDNTSAVQSFTITVNSVNDAPAGTNGTVTTNENFTYVFSAPNFGFTDPFDNPDDAFADLTVTSFTGGGTLKLSGSAFSLPQTIAVGNIPNLTFEPAPNTSGSPYASFDFVVRDNGGTADGGQDTDQSANTITINVLAKPVLKVIKHVINDNGGTRSAANFTMVIAGSGVSQNNFPGAESPGVTVTLNPGSYSVTETGPSGYAASFSGCSGTIAGGQTKTCTITNDDIAAVPVDCTKPTRVGTSNSETITGTEGDDVIDGKGGSDYIKGLGGRDVLCGGTGADTLDGGAGNDILRGDDDGDNLIGGTGNDSMIGGNGSDKCNGGDGSDSASTCENVTGVP
jgi:hypothetical protein